MSWDRNHVQRACSKINVADIRRPPLDAKGLLNFRHGSSDKLDIRFVYELGVPRDVVTVPVGVHYDEWHGIFLITFRPLCDDVHYYRTCIDLTCAGVFEQ